MRGRWILILVALLVTIFFNSAYPQAYPDKNISLIVAYPAGGSTDVGARVVAAIAEKDLGKPIIVLNKAGAGGQVGWTELAKQKPDGYSIGFINLPVMNSAILDPERKTTFGIDSFTPIINQVFDVSVVYVKPDSPYRNIKDIIHEARKRPGEIKAGSTGMFSDDHLSILMLEKMEKVKFRIVQFDGDVPQLTALLGGQIDVSFMNIGGLNPRVKAGQIRPLLVMDRERSKFYPDVPASAEAGYPQLIFSSTRGIVGPKGLPDPIVSKLQAVFKKAMDHPEHLEKMEKAGLGLRVMQGEEYAKYIMNLHENLKPLMEEALKAR
ncbi:MAG: putative Bug family protein, precursor [Deltaproteobacteria bacterium]|nr:putative Bug family protein, precursor [Deltaproteobacteria bacterium]